MNERRVVITGIGAITAAGSGVEGLWEGVLRRISPVRSIQRFDATGYRSQVAAEIDGFDPEDYLERRRAKRTDRFVQLTLAARRPTSPSDRRKVVGIPVKNRIIPSESTF